MKTLLTLVALTLPLIANAGPNMAEKTMKLTDSFNAEAEIAQLFNDSAAKPGNPIAKKVAALKAEYEGSVIVAVEPAHVWQLSHGRSGQYSGSVYAVAVWYGYKASGSHVAYAIARTHFDELNQDKVDVSIEKFVSALKIGDY